MATKAAGALAKLDVPNVAAALQQLEVELGGRQQLVGLLTLAPLTPDLRYVLGQLADPQHQRLTLATICVNANILPGELLKHLEGAAMLRGKVRAALEVAKGLPAVAADVMRRAAPFAEACNDCGGQGGRTPDPTPQVPNPTSVPCATCAGTGQLMYLPELRRQELALEMGQMLPKGGGLNIVNQNVNMAAGGQGGAGHLEQLQRLSDAILYGDQPQPQAVDAEILDPAAGAGE